MNIESREELRAYLQARGVLGSGDPLEMRVLPGGVSNRTVWLRRPAGEPWVLKQALQKLRVQADWFSSPTRVVNEARGIETLSKLVPGAVPELIFLDEEQYVLCMSAVAEPHENWKSMLLRGELDSDHVRQFAAILAGIHRRAREQRSTLQPIFADRQFFESLRLEPYYAYTAEQCPQSRAFLQSLINETRSHAETLVHGDYSPKNILVYAGKLTLLDHEVIHWGEPAFDIGFALTHFLSKANHLRQPSFIEVARQFWLTYSEQPGLVDHGERPGRHTLGCLLARIDGRSPLEYLDEIGRDRQRAVVLELMHGPRCDVLDVIDNFGKRILA